MTLQAFWNIVALGLLIVGVYVSTCGDKALVPWFVTVAVVWGIWGLLITCETPEDKKKHR